MKTAAKKTKKNVGGKKAPASGKKAAATKKPLAIRSRGPKTEWEPKKHEKEEYDALKLFVDTYFRF